MANKRIGQVASAFFEIKLEIGDMCFCADDKWTELNCFRVRSLGDSVEIGPYVDVMNYEPGRTLAGDERARLQPSPYSLAFRERYPHTADVAWLIQDLASSNLRDKGAVEVPLLISQIAGDARLTSVDETFIEVCLKSSVASGVFLAKVDGRTRDKVAKLELSPYQREVESKRFFAGTLADELTSYSERVRHLIRHTSSVGTYRENLLQSLLRKHLPERYHVATGFIYGCDRQIDVVIYDRIDYAPIFREGDLVVVPPESVRAIIEVKTNLTLHQLRTSLEQIEQLSNFDDCQPPFFKGIFAFETDVAPDRLLEEVVTFYTELPTEPAEDIEDDTEIDTRGWHQIHEPYHHLTCLCVLGLAYGHVSYELNKANHALRPALMSRTSAIRLQAQAAHFLETLLSYLRFGGLKPYEPFITSRMLGADTRMKHVGALTDDLWGTFLAREEGMDGAEENAKLAKATILATESWVNGRAWESPHNSINE